MEYDYKSFVACKYQLCMNCHHCKQHYFCKNTPNHHANILKQDCKNLQYRQLHHYNLTLYLKHNQTLNKFLHHYKHYYHCIENYREYSCKNQLPHCNYLWYKRLHRRKQLFLLDIPH